MNPWSLAHAIEIESARLWREWLARQAEEFAAEQAYLASLQWTDAQISNYRERVDGIHQRLDAFKGKR